MKECCFVIIILNSKPLNYDINYYNNLTYCILHNLMLNQNDFTIANEQSKNIITLPIHQYLTKKQLNYTAQKIKDFYDL